MKWSGCNYAKHLIRHQTAHSNNIRNSRAWKGDIGYADHLWCCPDGERSASLGDTGLVGGSATGCVFSAREYLDGFVSGSCKKLS